MADRTKPGFHQGGLRLAEGVRDGHIILVQALRAEWAALLALQEKATAMTAP
jgi:hypothetical protein